MLILILADVQYLQNVAFSFKKFHPPLAGEEVPATP